MAYAIIPQKDFKRVGTIAQGGFGTVYKALWNQREVAAKRLNKQEGNHEVKILEQLDHPNIVELLGVVDDEFDIYIILELCEGGSLRSYLDAHRGRHLGMRFYDWATQAARAIEYLKTVKVVHKDVKSPNFVITKDNILKLADFGLAKQIDVTISRATDRASFAWMAPELLSKNVLSPSYDIYALAVVIWELWTTDIPFEDSTIPENLMYRICHDHERPPIPKDCPKPIADLLLQCWETEWKKRPDMQHVLRVLIISEKEAKQALQYQIIAGPLEKKRKFGKEDGHGSLSGAEEIARDIAVSPIGNLLSSEKEAQRQLITGPWELEREIGEENGPGKLSGAYGIAVSPDGNVGITSYNTKDVCVYGDDGRYQFSLDTKQGLDHGKVSYPVNITVNADGIWYVTDCTPYVKMFSPQGVYKGRWGTVYPDGKKGYELLGLTIDANEHLLVGNASPMFVSRHRQDGSQIGSIKVNITPCYLAATSHGTIVISDQKSVQIVDKTGNVLHTLCNEHGKGMNNPLGVCVCDDIIYVCNRDKPKISCFSVSADYIGSIAVKDDPRCVTVLKGNSRLYMTTYNNKVLIYKNTV